MSDLGAIALALPDVERGIACAGTALESATYGVRGRTFLFVSPKDARLKLAASADEARGLGFAVGKNGWATLPLAQLPPARVLQRWIAESHALLGGAAGRTARAASAKKATKKAAKKPTHRGTR